MSQGSEKANHHHHSHSHSGHHHHHHHGNSGDGSLERMKGALILNLLFAVLEVIGGLYFNSIAILSDALHDFGDSAALGFAIYLEKVSQRKSNQQFTYGYRRFSVLGAVVTGFILILGSVFILLEAVPRLFNPELPVTEGMMAMAVFGVLVNGWAALKVSRGTSLNEKMLMWHMLEDVMGWALVLIGGIIIHFTEIAEIDAALGILLSLWIIYNVFRNLKRAASVFLMAVPTETSIAAAQELIFEASSEIKSVHHMHMWSLDGEKHIFTAHVVISDQLTWEQVSHLKGQIKSRLKKLGITEASLEVEKEGLICSDPEHPEGH